MILIFTKSECLKGSQYSCIVPLVALGEYLRLLGRCGGAVASWMSKVTIFSCGGLQKKKMDKG